MCAFERSNHAKKNMNIFSVQKTLSEGAMRLAHYSTKFQISSTEPRDQKPVFSEKTGFSFAHASHEINLMRDVDERALFDLAMPTRDPFL